MQSVSQSAEKCVEWEILKFHNNLMQRFRVDPKTFLGLAMPNQYSQTVKKQIAIKLVLGDNFWPKSPNLHDPYI